MQNIWSIVDLLRRYPHWWSPVISSAYGVKLDSRMLHKILCSWQKCYASIINTITLLINRHNDWFLPLLRQFFHSPNRTDKLWISEWNVLLPALISSAGILIIPGDVCLFNFSIAISNLKLLGSGTSGPAVCISVCLTLLTTCTFNSWGKLFLHLAKTLGVCKQITLIILYYINSRLVTLLKYTDATVHASDIFDLTVSLKFINFSFQIFILFVPEMSTIVTS